MAKTIYELKIAAAEVRDATEEKENTALRIGQLFLDTIETLGDVSTNAIKGYVVISSTSDLPTSPTTEQQMKGYLLGTTLYVWVGTGGDTLDGKYQSAQLKGETGATGPAGADGHDGVDLGEVALINDLTTGGEGNALSAEMGKELGEMVEVLGKNTEIVGDLTKTFGFEIKKAIFAASSSSPYYASSDIIPVPCDIAIDVTDEGEHTASLAYIMFCKGTTIIEDRLISRTLTTHFDVTASDTYDYVIVSYCLAGNSSDNAQGITASVVYHGANAINGYRDIMSKYDQIPTSLNLLDASLVQASHLTSAGAAEKDNLSALSWFINCEGENSLYVHLTRTTGSSQLRCGFYGDMTLSSFISIETLIVGGKSLTIKDSSVAVPSGAKYARFELSFYGGDGAVDYSQTYIGFYPFDETRAAHFYNFSLNGKDSSRASIFEPQQYITDEYLRNYANWASLRTTLFGKVYVAMGDSITAGYLAENNTKYCNVVGEDLVASVVNYASSGAHFTNYADTKIDFGGTTGDSPNVIQNQVYRLLRDITATTDIVPEIDANSEFTSNYSYPVYGLGTINADDVIAVTICAGTNDAATGVSLGSSADASGTDYTAFNKRTLWGAAAWAITILRKYLPNAHIVIVTPPQRTSNQSNTKAWADEELLVARSFCCQSIDLYGGCGISQQIEQINGHTYLADGLHPNAAGQQLIGHYIAGIFESWFKY